MVNMPPTGSVLSLAQTLNCLLLCHRQGPLEFPAHELKKYFRMGDGGDIDQTVTTTPGPYKGMYDADTYHRCMLSVVMFNVDYCN